MAKQKTIKDNNLFYGESEFELEQSYVEEYLHKSTNSDVIIYRVDRAKTVANMYGEAMPSQKQYKRKIELPCKINIIEEEPDFASDAGFGYEENLYAEFSVMERHLENREGFDIAIGDLARWRDRFYEIARVHNIPEASVYTKNYKNIMRKFKALMVKEDSIPFERIIDNEIN